MISNVVGLLCRFGGCDERFVPLTQSSSSDLADAAAQRNAHELQEHGYTHRPLPIVGNTFMKPGQRWPRRGTAE